MLAVSALKSPKNEREGEGSFSMEERERERDVGFADCGLLECSIDLDELFDLGIIEGDVLPDLEMDPEILADFPLTDESLVPSLSLDQNFNLLEEEEEQQHSVSDVSSTPHNIINESHHKPPRKPMLNSKNPHAKRKVKVDWTPELHRRFVQAVEQLGVDKAVPSRILELMGIDCLTRHNIASHLQKYRSHRKHLLAREAEAASWSQRRQLYGGAGKRDRLNPWSAPTMGFPPVTPQPMPHHFRPLHVWGHPSVDQSMMPIWPKHLNPPPHSWPPPHPTPPPADPSFWIPHHHVPTPGTPCFPPARFPPPPVAGVPPSGIYKVEQTGLGFPTVVASRQTLPHPPSDIHPSKESVDAAIGDVLSKPWLPLPLGLKPPSVDGVMVELQRQGISNVPPSCA